MKPADSQVGEISQRDRPALKRRFRTPWWSAALMLAALVGSRANARPPRIDSTPLTKLAAARFANLTRAERALLEFADKSDLDRGEFAVAGTSGAPLDPTNDPKDAAKWPHDREVRADLIRWMATDPEALQRIDPTGVRLLGARIVGPLKLSRLRIPFGLECIRCSIPERIELESSEIPFLDLDGSYSAEIRAPLLSVQGDVQLAAYDENGRRLGTFDAASVVNLTGLKAGGQLNLAGGHFHYSEQASHGGKLWRMAIWISNAEVKLDVNACCGFESDGGFAMNEATIGGDFNAFGGRFFNPNRSALALVGTNIFGGIVLAPHFSPTFSEFGGRFESNGMVDLWTTRAVGLIVRQAKFGGKAGEVHGLNAQFASIHNGIVWRDVDLENGAILNLSSADIAFLADDERSWPAPGKLEIDNFKYTLFGGPGLAAPPDASARLRWLRLQPPGYHPQPYRQLAHVLRENGDESGAIQVLIASDDARYSELGFFWRIWGGFLKATIGYGHEPLRTMLWSLAVILLGWLLVSIGSRAGVMCETWPENKPLEARKRYERLSPLLYSLDVFLPFVSLHQEHYWWPDAELSGDCPVLNRKVPCSGRMLRRYLWMQIIAGWVLSAIFIAGVTGLLRND